VNKFLIALASVLLIACSASAEETAIKPYQKGDWASILKMANGQPMAIHFWGVTCAPCAKEMPKWEKFIVSNKADRVVFIQVDDVPPEIMQKMLEKSKLISANNFYIAGPFDDRLRYEISPKWRGETPITIFVDKTGKQEMTVGPVNFSTVKTWFKSHS
jgi:thiol-disulfide isomerase/thioredoxin